MKSCIMWIHHALRILDFEDLRILEIWLRFGDFLKTSHPRMKDIEDLGIYFFKSSVNFYKYIFFQATRLKGNIGGEL